MKIKPFYITATFLWALLVYVVLCALNIMWSFNIIALYIIGFVFVVELLGDLISVYIFKCDVDRDDSEEKEKEDKEYKDG